MSKLRGNWRVRECSERMEHVLDKLYKAEVEDKHTQLSDVLGDLMHFAYRHDLDFESALDSAYGYVSVERAPGYSEGKRRATADTEYDVVTQVRVRVKAHDEVEAENKVLDLFEDILIDLQSESKGVVEAGVALTQDNPKSEEVHRGKEVEEVQRAQGKLKEEKGK